MITFLLTTVIATILLTTLLTYTLYCYEESNQTGKPLPHFLSMAGKTILRSIGSEIMIFTLLPFGLWPRLWTEPTNGKALVVMVHGLFHNRSAWFRYRRWLHARGYATACYSYPSWGTDWDDTVTGLRAFLTPLIQAHPGRDVHLIGHSMGGLLLRSALAQIDEPRPVRSLVTMGTPFAGSKLSPFALSSLGRYLKHDGETVCKLAQLPIPPQVRCLALRSPADNMVLPNTALRCGLPGWTELETQPVSHVAMLHHKGIFHEVLSWIQADTA